MVGRLKAGATALILLTATACAAVPVTAQQRSLRHLKAWADELPVRGLGAKRRTIFEDSGLRIALIRLMGAAEFSRMVARFEVSSPADLAAGHLVLRGWQEHNASDGYVVVVELGTGDVWAAKTNALSVKWYGDRTPGRVPTCLIENFLPREGERY
jgi:hypothetical protein